ncbi:hypothetical protein KC315_g8975, partial [Hortaea werneckii]
KENAKGNKELSREEIQDRKKRLIVEFAIENAQVVMRRGEREAKARERSRAVQEGRAPSFKGDAAKRDAAKNQKFKRDRKEGKSGPLKRKRGSDDAVQGKKPGKKPSGGDADKPSAGKKEVDEKLAKRNQIIGRKRAMRKARSGGKS